MVLLTLPNMLIAGLTVLLFFIFIEMKRLQRNAVHRDMMYDMQQIRASQTQGMYSPQMQNSMPRPVTSHHIHPTQHHQQNVAIAGNIQARPIVMAAIQEAKTEVLEHFVKKKFKDQNPKKDLPHMTAS